MVPRRSIDKTAADSPLQPYSVCLPHQSADLTAALRTRRHPRAERAWHSMRCRRNLLSWQYSSSRQYNWWPAGPSGELFRHSTWAGGIYRPHPRKQVAPL